MRHFDAVSGNEARLTEDRFLGQRLKINQPAKGFRSGHDAVLLAASVDMGARVEPRPRLGSGSGSGHQVCELGSGVGVASLCVAVRCAQARVHGIEIDPAALVLGQQNARANGLEARVQFSQGDVTGAFNALGVQANYFDQVIANPPYYTQGTVPAPDAHKQTALIGHSQTLEKWTRCAAALLRARGHLYFIHRADTLAYLLEAMRSRFGDLQVRPVFARATKMATRVIVRGCRDSKGPVQILPPLVLHDATGSPSAAADTILRHGAALAFDWTDS